MGPEIRTSHICEENLNCICLPSIISAESVARTNPKKDNLVDQWSGPEQTYRVGPQDLQIRFSGFQQLGHHVQETLHKRFDALRVTRHQQLVQSLHGDHHVPDTKKTFISWMGLV